MGVVYKITSPSGKGYVGQTRRLLHKRLNRHRDLKWGNCKLLKRAIGKYGWAKMQVQVLWTGNDHELNGKEVELINEHGTLAPHGYNSLPGGDVNPMSVQRGRDSVRDSWADPVVRERHRQGRLNAWQDPVKRANQLAAREKVREAKIAKYPLEEQDAVRARFKRQREAHARWKERKQLTSSRSRPLPHSSTVGGSRVGKGKRWVQAIPAYSGASPHSPRSAQAVVKLCAAHEAIKARVFECVASYRAH